MDGRRFDTCYSMKFNGEELRIIPAPGTHPDSDLMVYFTGSKVLHMGSRLLRESFPGVGKDVKPYMKTHETSLDVFPEGTFFVAGHGRTCRKKEAADYLKTMRTLRDRILAEKEAGKTAQKLMDAKFLEEFREDYGQIINFLGPDYWIRAVFMSEEEEKTEGR